VNASFVHVFLIYSMMTGFDELLLMLSDKLSV